jgi:hypothetical protein
MNQSTSFPYGANIVAKKKSATKKRKGPNGLSKSEKIRKYKETHLKATTQEIADALGYDYGTVYQAISKKKPGKKTKKARKVRGDEHGGHTGNGHSATELVRMALGLGLDKTIKLLEKVKAAVE